MTTSGGAMGRGCVAVALAIMFVIVRNGADAERTDDRAIVWQSRNDTFKELTKEFAGLYANLIELRDHGRMVPTTTVDVPDRKTLAAVLRDRQLFDGVYLPKQLDVFVCQANPRVCTVQLGKSGTVVADDATAVWKIKAGDKIVVPDINFTSIIVHRPYEKRPGDTLKSIVVDDRHGCESFDDECQRYIQNLNRRLPGILDAAYGGKIIVPTKAYRAVIPLVRQDQGGESAERSERMDVEARGSSRPPPTSRAMGLKGHEVSRDAVSTVPALKDHVVPSSEATLHQPAAAPAGAEGEGSRSLLLTLIRHPLSTVKSLTLPPAAKANVAVFDSWVDQAHCLLSNVTVLDPDGLAFQVQRVADCGDRGDATAAQDHGTHVVGLIGMRVDGKQGPGIDPYATIKALSINPDSFRSPLYLATQSDRLRDLYRTDPPDVVNMSFEYNLSTEEGRNDVFHAAMKELQRDTLFVVSAGNDGAALSSTGDCRVRPACYDDMNIVTVGALNLDANAPAMMSTPGRASNYGDRVHVAAPGENIVSTISGDRMGLMSGTSQAAPEVAGAASLLYLYERRLQPSQVKNRLIYTCDLFPSLYSQVRGGRLNVQRLLAYKAATVDVSDGSHVEGSLHDPVATYLAFRDFNTSEAFLLSFVQVRRLMFNPSLGYYTLFYNDDVGRDTGLLKRRFVTLTSPNTAVLFGVSTGPGMPERSVEVKAKDIIDYVSPILL